MLGAWRSRAGAALFPMDPARRAAVRATVALVGDAAHVFPPIGAQGLNLGLRDVAARRDGVRARGAGADFGGEATLAAYAAARRPDIAARTLAVSGLNASLLTRISPVDARAGWDSPPSPRSRRCGGW